MSIQDQSAGRANFAAALANTVAAAEKNGSTLRVRVEAERLWTATAEPDMTREELEQEISRIAFRRGIPIEI